MKINVDLDVAACNGRASRIVIAYAGGKSLTDKFDTSVAKFRKSFIKALADKLEVGIEAVEHLDDELVAKAEQADRDADAKVAELKASLANQATPDEARQRLLDDTPDDIKAEAELMLKSPDLVKTIVSDINCLGVAGERELATIVYLTGTSRLLTKPLSCIVQGPSSSGKSYVIETVASMFPAETTVLATQMTPQALFHMEPGSLMNRFVVCGERSRMENDERAEATRSLREMISAGRLVKLMPVKVDGEIQTVSIVQEGPIAFIESTTLSKVFDEDANRCVLLSTDERKEQTSRIVKSLGEAYSGKVPRSQPQHIREVHHALQRMLDPHYVVVPFAERLGELIAKDKVECRRAFPLTVSAVQASALLHQRQRELDDDGRLIATADDYKLVRHLLTKPMSRLLANTVSDPALRFFERVGSRVSGIFTTRDAAKDESVKERAVRGWLVELADAGLVDVIEQGRGQKQTTWRLVLDAAAEVAEGHLPSFENVFGEK